MHNRGRVKVKSARLLGVGESGSPLLTEGVGREVRSATCWDGQCAKVGDEVVEAGVEAVEPLVGELCE